MTILLRDLEGKEYSVQLVRSLSISVAVGSDGLNITEGVGCNVNGKEDNTLAIRAPDVSNGQGQRVLPPMLNTIRVRLHLIMESLRGRDLHDEIKSWQGAIRVDGQDTGRRMGHYIWEEDGEIMSYQMPRGLKLYLAEEILRGMEEVHSNGVVHNDIKPSNMLVADVHRTPSKPALKCVKIIDFGESEKSGDNLGLVSGTAGYRAPENEKEGRFLVVSRVCMHANNTGYVHKVFACIYASDVCLSHRHKCFCRISNAGKCTSASDMHAVGVSLVELWSGNIWEGAETRGEGFDGMRKEILAGLDKIAKADPTVAKILRRCVSERANNRPSAPNLLQAVKVLRSRTKPTSKKPTSKFIARKGRGWAAAGRL